MWQIGQIITCVFVLQYDWPEGHVWREKATELSCVVKEVYFDPNCNCGDSYAMIDCTSDIKNKYKITKSHQNDPIRLVYKSEEKCF